MLALLHMIHALSAATAEGSCCLCCGRPFSYRNHEVVIAASLRRNHMSIACSDDTAWHASDSTFEVCEITEDFNFSHLHSISCFYILMFILDLCGHAGQLTLEGLRVNQLNLTRKLSGQLQIDQQGVHVHAKVIHHAH